MAESPCPERHQLAGLDDRERGFSRQIELEAGREGFRAVLRYERLLMSSEILPTQEEALRALIQSLQIQGFRRLKTQLIFRSGAYLGSRELWVEHPDPPAEPPARSWLVRLTGWFSRAPAGDERP